MYTEFPLKNILSKADLFGQLSEWAIELRQSDIKFLPMATIKRHVLADFGAEFSPRAVSQEQACIESTHKEGESLEAGSSKIQSVLRV